MLQLKNQRPGGKNACSFSIILVLKGIMTSSSQRVHEFVEKNTKFNKNKTESKMENSTHNSKRPSLSFSSYKNRKLIVKLWWVGAHKRKKSIFCTVYFVRRKFFYHLCFISMYNVLNTLSEYLYFTYQKILVHTLSLLVFKIVESLLCILKNIRQ